MQLDKYKNKGYTGLTNLGNTCFLNSCMQALNHTYELNEILLAKESQLILNKSLPDTIIIEEWNSLRDTMWKQNGVVSPNRFVHFVQQLAVKKNRDLFTGYAQNDLPEFLLFIIECMHNSLSRKVKLNIKGMSKMMWISCARAVIKCYSKHMQTNIPKSWICFMVFMCPN